MNMQMKRIEDLSSFVREIDSECTTLNMNHKYIIAGSKSGKIICWDVYSGKEKWNIDVNGPVSELSLSDEIYVTASAELHAIETESGKLKWSIDIQGSSDLVYVDDEFVYVTSSLYEIEIEDYTETTLFQFDKNGNLNWKIEFEEKPWFIGKISGEIILGIGRPRCGYLSVNEKSNISHWQIEESPVNMGITTNLGFLLGHSNGIVVESINGKIRKFQCGNDPISAMNSNNESWQVGNKNGRILTSENIEVELDGNIDSILESERFFWVSTSTNENSVYLLDKKNGSIKYQFSHRSRIRFMRLNDNNLTMSDDEGMIMLFDLDRLDKKIESKNEEVEDLERRNLLKKRLRELRG